MNLSWSLCRCVMLTLEKILSFISYNVMIITAINGTSFCTSAWTTFNIYYNNPLPTIVLAGIANFFLFLSKVCISFLTGMVTFFLFSNKFPWFIQFQTLNSFWFPVIVSVDFHNQWMNSSYKSIFVVKNLFLFLTVSVYKCRYISNCRYLSDSLSSRHWFNVY